MEIIGWDIGGAHIKVSKINFSKEKTITKQLYCPIWMNINNLNKSILKIKKQLGRSDYHAITMTAELSDIFKNEEEQRFIKAMKKASRVMIIGRTEKGKQTIDHYSLMGFTKAYDTAKKNCS